MTNQPRLDRRGRNRGELETTAAPGVAATRGNADPGHPVAVPLETDRPQLQECGGTLVGAKEQGGRPTTSAQGVGSRFGGQSDRGTGGKLDTERVAGFSLDRSFV
jgi:hypothetical protein